LSLCDTPPGDSAATAAEIAVYRASGLVILIGVAVFNPMTKAGWDRLLVLETVILVSFGIAWLVRGTTLPGKAGPGPGICAGSGSRRPVRVPVNVRESLGRCPGRRRGCCALGASRGVWMTWTCLLVTYALST
jgi:hypothetical protein